MHEIFAIIAAYCQTVQQLILIRFILGVYIIRLLLMMLLWKCLTLLVCHILLYINMRWVIAILNECGIKYYFFNEPFLFVLPRSKRLNIFII